MRLLPFCFVTLLAAQAAHGQVSRPDPVQPQSHGFSFTAALDAPLSYEEQDAEGERTQGEETFHSPRLSLTLRYTKPKSYWFGRLTMHRYLDENRQAPWNPDFTYSLGYDDWHPGTLAVTYDNYGGNRFAPDSGEKVTRFEEGTISAIYRIPVPDRVESIFVPHPDDRLSASIGAHVTPRFQRHDTAARGEWKRSVSFGVRNRFHRSWYVEGRAFYYPDSAQQQPWDPDYTYGFGWFDWRPGKVSVQYGNYAGNRFPGRAGSRKTSWRDGSVSIAWSHSW